MPRRSRVIAADLACALDQDCWPEFFAEFHPSSATQLRISRSELTFQLLPDFLRQRRTLPRSRNCDLQIAALHYCRIIKIALFRDIDHIAQDATGLRLTEHELIQIARRSGYDNQENTVQIRQNEIALFEHDLAQPRPLPHGFARFMRDDVNLGSGRQEPTNLGLANLSRTDDEHLAAIQLHEHRK